jgi:hypothetical protein
VFNTVSNKADPKSVMGRAVCAGGLGDIKGAGLLLEQFIAGDVSDHMVLRACAAFLEASPDLVASSEVIRDLNRRYDNAGLSNLLEFVSQIQPPKRALLNGNIRDNEVQLSEAGQTGAVVLVFAGFGRRTGAMPFSLIDRFFAGHGVAVSSMVDASAKLYWGGLPSLGATLDATICELKVRLAAINTTKIYTLGNSAGGIGAMVYGCALNARRALSFSAPTDLRESFLLEHGDARAQVAIHALNKRLNEGQLNLRGWLESQEHRCPIHAYFCENEKNDALQARNIAHLSEVSLHPIRHYSVHESIASALGTGDLLQEFNSILKDIKNE